MTSVTLFEPKNSPALRGHRWVRALVSTLEARLGLVYAGLTRAGLVYVAIACTVLAPMAFADSESSPLAVGETFTLPSAVLEEDRVINVYRPPGASEPGPLPVLYMPDGGIGEDFLHVAGLVQISVVNGTMRPFLLVGIENTERRRDLTGPTRNPQDKAIAPRTGGSASFRRFLREELMPEIEARYATTTERAIVGESLAGLFIVETLLLEPDLFDTYLAFDPSLWWDDRRLVREAHRLRQSQRGLEKTLFLASGDQSEISEATHQLAEALASTPAPGLLWHHQPMPDEKHHTIYHPAALAAFREVLSPGTLFLHGKRKTTLATLRGVERAGHTCRLDLIDQGGDVFQELAKAELCEQRGIVSKRVELTYGIARTDGTELTDRPTRTADASCVEDPECRGNETVVFVERAAPRQFWAPSHCRPEEMKVFSCGTTEQRVMSLCASSELNEEAGYLQYRFGAFGEPPGLIHPLGEEHPREHFLAGSLSFSGGGGGYLKFKRGASTYVVFTGIGKGWQKEGIVVTAPGREPVELLCRSQWTSEIGPELFETAGLEVDPEGFELPSE